MKHLLRMVLSPRLYIVTLILNAVIIVAAATTITVLVVPLLSDRAVPPFRLVLVALAAASYFAPALWLGVGTSRADIIECLKRNKPYEHLVLTRAAILVPALSPLVLLYVFLFRMGLDDETAVLVARATAPSDEELKGGITCATDSTD